MAEELRFAVRCTGSSTKSLSNPEHKKPRKTTVTDNGLTLMPLTGSYTYNGSGRSAASSKYIST